MEIDKNYFELFSLPVDFDVDSSNLSVTFRELQKAVHPDKFVKGGGQERLRSVQQAALINEAYDTLKDPLRRAKYLLEINGLLLDKDNNSTLSPAFLMQQIEMREQIELAKQQKDMDMLDQTNDQISRLLSARFDLIGKLFCQPSPDFEKIVEHVQEAQFFTRMQESVDAISIAIENSEE